MNVLKPMLTYWKSLPPVERKFWTRAYHVLGMIACVMIPAYFAGIDLGDAAKMAVVPILKDWLSLHSQLPRDPADYQVREASAEQ